MRPLTEEEKAYIALRREIQRQDQEEADQCSSGGIARQRTGVPTPPAHLLKSMVLEPPAKPRISPDGRAALPRQSQTPSLSWIQTTDVVGTGTTTSGTQVVQPPQLSSIYKGF